MSGSIAAAKSVRAFTGKKETDRLDARHDKSGAHEPRQLSMTIDCGRNRAYRAKPAYPLRCRIGHACDLCIFSMDDWFLWHWSLWPRRPYAASIC
jgi:hypothetical protein